MSEQSLLTTTDAAVAIIGMAGRFPGAASVDELWKNIAGGVSSIRRLSDAELIAAGVDPDQLDDPRLVKVGSTIDDIELFDAAFFGYSPREAAVMDPQHRLFLECAWQALESAGYDPYAYPGIIGLFGGSAFPTYLQNNLATHPDLIRELGTLGIGVGHDRASLTSKVSYKLNLRGPSISVQTACSTSMVAVHLACQSLLTYESDLTLAGGVTIAVPQTTGYLYEQGGILAPDGVCRSLDAGAQGSVLGNGVGLVVLKRLSEALDDGDHIYAVIRGSTVNNDGMARAGYTAPGTDGQAEVVAEALTAAGVGADTIDYVELHGTGTALGDSIELAAMARAFRSGTQRKRYCAIGSVKPNVGHLDHASGVTGLVKTALALHHKQLPPVVNYRVPNPALDVDNGPFFVNTELAEWPEHAAPRRAGVSSFGLGGTNAHLILEEAPARLPAQASDAPHILLLSARSAAALDQARANLLIHLQHHPDLDPSDLAFTLQVGRVHFNHRAALVYDDVGQAAAGLSDAQTLMTANQTGRERRTGFLIPHSGPNSGHLPVDLSDLDPGVDEDVAECLAVIEPSRRTSVQAVLHGGNSPAPAVHDLATFVVEYTLGRLLMRWGIRADVFVGDGVGACVAACLSGERSLASALASVPTAERQGSGNIARRLEELAGDTNRVLVEVGVGRSLSTLASEWGWSSDPSGRLVQPALGDDASSTSRANARGVLRAVARLWLAGVSVDWSALHAGRDAHRMPLPTYPFERQRHWIEPAAPAEAENTRARATGKKRDVGDWFYLPGWKRTLGVPVAALGSSAELGPWLILSEGDSLGERLAERLAADGAEVVTVRAGASFEEPSDRERVLDPSHPADYDRLLDSLSRAPRSIVHLWSLAETTDEPGSAAFETAQETGFYSLLHLARALSRSPRAESVRLWAVTRNAFAVNGAEDLAPEQVPLALACRVLDQEQASVDGFHIDVGRVSAGWEEQALVERLVQELVAERPEPSTAFRGVERWSPTFDAARLDPPSDQLVGLRERGVYLITGGLGGVGVVMAEHLAATRSARIVLTSRREFPPRSEWTIWLDEHAEDDTTSQTIRRLAALEAHAAEVLVLTADVANEHDMRRVIATTEERFGTLNGVVHAAGITDPRLFGLALELDRAACETHFRPKVHGLYVLERVLADRQLDFCVLMSSLSAVLGGLGFVAYAAANAFVDAFAHRHNQRSAQRWLAVNWGTWHVRDEEHLAPGTTLADYAMEPAEGLAAFERVLAYRGVATQLINSTGDLQARLEQWVQRDEPASSEPADMVVHERPALATAYVAPSDPLEEQLAAIWRATLGIDAVGVHDHFLELGGHSLMATQLMARIRAALGVDLPLTCLVEGPTVRELARAVAERRDAVLSHPRES